MKKIIGLVAVLSLVGCGAEVPLDITEAPPTVHEIGESHVVSVPLFDEQDNVVGAEFVKVVEVPVLDEQDNVVGTETVITE